ncbi:MAG: type III pantothenate kinase [Muribaculaceae bacterium]|nr:type III pantothenate kinase [Muribaculaceae bacterium]
MGKKRFLAVDQGNSMLKLTLLEEGGKSEACRFSPDAIDEIFSVMERWKPDCGAFCSVGKIDPRFVESLRLSMNGNLLILSRSSKLPISIDYATPATLGLDRVALAAGAVALYKGTPVAVVDAGTAVTLDVIDGNDTFCGGRITAGLRLRFEALHSHTSALPLVEASGQLPIAGDSTETCIRSGVVLGLADEITETYRQYQNQFGCKRLILTGGDAELLADCINSRIPVEYEPDLMAHGLLYIYKCNE